MLRSRRSALFPAALILLALPLAPCSEGSEPRLHGNLEEIDGVRVLWLWGAPRDRGYAHGWLLADEILAGMEQGFSAFLGGDSTRYSEQVLPLVTKAFVFGEDELAELEGLAAGIRARYPNREIKLLGRAPGVDDLKVLNTFGDWYSLGCSSVALWGSRTRVGKAIAVRNFDFMKFELSLRGQHVRVVAPSQGAQGWVGVCHAGSIGTVTAMNGAGVYVAIHDVPVRPSLTDFVEKNVPRLLALRRLVEQLAPQGAVEKAAELCRSWNTLFGNNFLVATPDPGGGLPAGVLEYDAHEERDGGVTLRGPDASDGGGKDPYVICTNHHRSRSSGRCGRYQALEEGCREGPDRFDLEALIALAERAAEPGPGQTGGFVMTLHQAVARTGERRLWVRLIGSPATNIRDARGVDLDISELLSDERLKEIPATEKVTAAGASSTPEAAVGGALHGGH